MCQFVAQWPLQQQTVAYLCEEFEMSRETVIDWCNYLRDLCEHAVNLREKKIGGPAKTVEIDEAKIGHRKQNKGRIVEGTWVFGMIERESGVCILVPVETRNSATLIPIIRNHVLPGTTIISDCWKAYGSLQSIDFNHLTVNHGMNFVDPDSGARTQYIECLWRDLRHSIPNLGTGGITSKAILPNFYFFGKTNS